MVKRKSNNKNKKYKTKKSKTLPKAVICYTPGICPDVMRCQLTYNTRQNALGGGTVPILDFVYRGNSLFDPDFALGGQQPKGFDEWSNFYRRYRVRAAKIVLQASTDSAVNAGFGIVINNTSSFLTDRDVAIESQFSVNKLIGGDGMNGIGTLEMYMPTHVIRGGPPDLVQYETDLSAVTSSNPNQVWYIHTYGYGVGGSGNNFEVNLDTKIIYYVDFYDRDQLQGS